MRSCVLTPLLFASGLAITRGAEPAKDSLGKEALSPFQGYVGQWRGVGQPRRGSSRGAWQERCDWVWKFSDGKAALEVHFTDSKFLQAATLRPLAEAESFVLAVSANGEETRYMGKLDEQGVLSLVAEEDDVRADWPARIQMRQVAEGARMLVLYERRVGDRFQRLAEVGYTRAGSEFGRGVNYVECVVTGGVGTIPVTHAGKTYHVCCTGCRDYFNQDPAGVLAEYKAQKEKVGQPRADGDNGGGDTDVID